MRRLLASSTCSVALPASRGPARAGLIRSAGANRVAPPHPDASPCSSREGAKRPRSLSRVATECPCSRQLALRVMPLCTCSWLLPCSPSTIAAGRATDPEVLF